MEWIHNDTVWYHHSVLFLPTFFSSMKWKLENWVGKSTTNIVCAGGISDVYDLSNYWYCLMWLQKIRVPNSSVELRWIREYLWGGGLVCCSNTYIIVRIWGYFFYGSSKIKLTWLFATNIVNRCWRRTCLTHERTGSFLYLFKGPVWK